MCSEILTPRGIGSIDLSFLSFFSSLSSERERVLAHLDSVLVVPEGMQPQEGTFVLNVGAFSRAKH